MVNPGFEKLGQIQTPVKSDMKYEYPIEPPPSLSNNVSINYENTMPCRYILENLSIVTVWQGYLS